MDTAVEESGTVSLMKVLRKKGRTDAIRISTVKTGLRFEKLKFCRSKTPNPRKVLGKENP